MNKSNNNITTNEILTLNGKIENKNSIHIGDSQANFFEKKIKGELISFENESYYKISNYDEMRPFFMSIVSDSNHWMFLSSNGGLTAGRKNSNSALFPYYTDDKITELAHTTGSRTIIHVDHNNSIKLWEPFSERYNGVYNITRNLYKSRYGNKVIFEEINHSFNLIFRYQWNSSNLFGFVKKSKIINLNSYTVNVSMLDGIQNILPSGVGEQLQNSYSNLVDAYKRNELLQNLGIGIYSLSAIIVDKAEPSEALKASIAWSLNIDDANYLISSKQLNAFRQRKTLEKEFDIKAEKGAYFIQTEIKLESKAEKDWLIVANVNQNMVDLAKLSQDLKTPQKLKQRVLDDIELGTKRLLELNGAADGLQISTNKLRNTRHFSNTLFNIMRGGIFDNNYQIEKSDFLKYISNCNKKVYKKKESILQSLPKEFTAQYLKNLANQGEFHNEDKNFKRLCYEYMPLKFSRRHGDPSRPWNQFSINTRSELDGSKILDYQGNWRDIFQNWEALAHSYPEFVENMIHKFLNATTFDGYNPYRVMKNGFDWETIEPHDPWSYIGYWGDHQIIYLLKFLEFIEDYYPNKLATYFSQEIFVYANVPYKIKSYNEILKNPKDTIIFDVDEEKRILQKREEIGIDGALLRDQNYFIYKVNLIEKLLATVLAKLSNFVPEAGIWMNTQRPEWNDANNALVGNGVSMVTLYYLKRFLIFFGNVIQKSELQEVEISTELKDFFNKVKSTFEQHESLLTTNISNKDRKTIMDGLGNAGSDFRNKIYESSFSGGRDTVLKDELESLILVAQNYLEHAIRANKRTDKLYHAYNLITVKGDEVTISYLSEMLEGQVAALSSGHISSKEALSILDALKNSSLFREDQYSYILYPNKQLLGFVSKNNIPPSSIDKSELLKKLLDENNGSILEKDVEGNYHFNSNFNNAENLKNAIAELDQEAYGKLIEKEKVLVLNIFEEVFDHKSFTGRSGTFFGYEGLGSIYWHMVSKLLLAVQEVCLEAIKNNESTEVIGRLLEHYYEINEGIGVHKSPELYGAFPTDPYSHTPLGKGAQQPGMTGQVKEDMLCRFGELGIVVDKGQLQFNPVMLRKNEFLKSHRIFNYVDVNKTHNRIDVTENQMAFTYCQVPIVYQLAKENKVIINLKDTENKEVKGLKLDRETSQLIFMRTGVVSMIEVHVKKEILK